MTETPVDSQITDKITQINVKTVGESPSAAMGAIYQSLGNTTNSAMENAVQTEGGTEQIDPTSVTASCNY